MEIYTLCISSSQSNHRSSPPPDWQIWTPKKTTWLLGMIIDFSKISSCFPSGWLHPKSICQLNYSRTQPILIQRKEFKDPIPFVSCFRSFYVLIKLFSNMFYTHLKKELEVSVPFISCFESFHVLIKLFSNMTYTYLRTEVEDYVLFVSCFHHSTFWIRLSNTIYTHSRKESEDYFPFVSCFTIIPWSN